MMAKEIGIGFAVGIIANALGIFLYIFTFSEAGVQETLEAAQREGYLGSLITLGAILNLIAFFMFIKQKKLYRARGVLLATVLAAIMIVISKF